ncbi:hypothetical protein [Micromonospora chersina]|uniref:hypothetical protein n=1 Tax=Micromonospora chersina TaxID=47854 RepID=UPI0036950E2E
MRFVTSGLVVLAAGLLVAGRWDLALGVGVGGLLGWVLMEPIRITWAIFVISFAIPVTIDFGYPTNPSYTLLLILFVLAAWGRVLRAERDGWPRALIGAALLLPSCAVLAGVVHWHGAKPVVVGVAPLLCFGVLGWHLVEEARRDPQSILRLAEVLTWLSVAVAAFAKYQTLSHTWPIFDQLAYTWTYTSAFDATRAVGISGHPIIYGTFAMAMALAALTIRGRFWYIPFTANLVGLVLSGTRSAWIGMILALAFWLFFQWRKVSWRGIGGAIAVAAAAFTVVAVGPSTFSFIAPAPEPTWVSGPVWVSPAPAKTSAAAAPAKTPAAGVPARTSAAGVPARTSAAAVPAKTSAAAVPAKTSAAATSTSGNSVDDVGSRLSNPIGSASADARFVRMRVVWSGITRDLSTVVFGNGPEANVRFLERVALGDGQAQVFDNTYLTFWYNYGLIGLSSLLLLMVTLYRRLQSLPARLLLVGASAQIFFFDAWLWLGAVGVLLLAVALGAAGNPSLAAQPLPGFGPRRHRSRAAESALETRSVPAGVR